MPDLWSEREFCGMQAPLAERDLVEQQLVHDAKSHSVEGRGYTWRQTPEELEIQFVGHKLEPGSSANVSVSIRPNHLTVRVCDALAFDDDLWAAVSPDDSTWTLEQDGILRIELLKVEQEPPELNNWPRCGRSEPHKYEAEHQAKLARKEERRKAQAEKLLQEAKAEAEAAEARATAKDEAIAAPEESESDSEEDETDAGEGSVCRGVPTTGTQAERLRLERERVAKEAKSWESRNPQMAGARLC